MEEGAYQDYLKTCKEPVQVFFSFVCRRVSDLNLQKSTCNAHKAVNDATKREFKGLAASGLGTIECIRHDFKRGMSSGDLRQGER